MACVGEGKERERSKPLEIMIFPRIFFVTLHCLLSE